MIVENCKSRGKYLEIQFAGGLGNQLFQLSHAIALSLGNGCHFRLLPPLMGRKFNIEWLGFTANATYDVSIQQDELHIIEIRDCLCESHLRYEEPAFVSTPKIDWESGFRIHGYFQSEIFFYSYRREIRNFYLDRLRASSDYRNSSKSTICIHARFGDMAREKKARRFHGVVGDEYLISALANLDYLTQDLEIELVTDDVESIWQEIPLTSQLTGKIISSINPLDDLRILAESDRLIISNSTFSWWAAYLSSANVVAPLNWFTGSYSSLELSSFLYQKDWKVI